MREYVLKDPLFPDSGVTITCQNDRDCIFCDHCTDIWWDYSHPGFIWGVTCEEGHDPNERPCQFFVEEGRGAKNVDIMSIWVPGEDIVTIFTSLK